jgi:hypothetical protein
LISTYSSFGPTLDGRLVPQISAVGSTVYSLIMDINEWNLYTASEQFVYDIKYL